MKKDIIIVGAGPAGLSLACSLEETGLKVTIVEKLSEEILADPPYDGREIALTHLSQAILQKLDIWDRFPLGEVSELKEAKVLDGDSSYALHFDYRNISKNTLGFMVSNHIIRKALYQKVKKLKDVDLIPEASVTSVKTKSDQASVTLSNGNTIEASLIVAADSRFSEMRRKMGISASTCDFGRIIIVCQMKHEKPHNSIAYECFHYGQTLAVLPLSEGKSSIVITVPTDKSEDILNMNEDEFNSSIQKQFKNKLGKMELISKRFPYPLVSVYANNFVATRFALVGDAAVGMHPVTAHGYNLGLRGQDTLATQIKLALAQNRDIASPSVLKAYQSKHRRISRPMYLGTNAIVKLYTNDFLLPKIIRKGVLRFANNFTPIKQGIMRKLTEIYT